MEFKLNLSVRYPPPKSEDNELTPLTTLHQQPDPPAAKPKETVKKPTSTPLELSLSLSPTLNTTHPQPVPSTSTATDPFLNVAFSPVLPSSASVEQDKREKEPTPGITLELDDPGQVEEAHKEDKAVEITIDESDKDDGDQPKEKEVEEQDEATTAKGRTTTVEEDDEEDLSFLLSLDTGETNKEAQRYEDESDFIALEDLSVVDIEELPKNSVAANFPSCDAFSEPLLRLQLLQQPTEHDNILSTLSDNIGDDWHPPQDEVPVNAMQPAVPSLTLDPKGDIPVTTENTYGPASSLSIATVVDDSIRLSSSYAASLARVDMLILLAPCGFRDRPSLSLETRWNTARTLLNSMQLRRVEALSGLVLRWLRWCEEENVPPEHRFPAQERMVFAWIAGLGGKYSPGYIQQHYQALQFWHHLHLLPFSLDPALRSRIARGSTNLAPKSRDDRRGITVHDMLDIYKYLMNENKGNPEKACRSAAFWAACLFGFFGMARCKDFTLPRRTPYKKATKKNPNAKKVKTFDPDYHTHGGCFTFFKGSSKFPPVVKVMIPYDKVRKRKGDHIQIAEQADFHPCLDPVFAFAEHLRMNKPTANDPAFSFYGDNGKRMFLTRSFFIQHIRDALSAAGRDSNVHGHSFRIGGANFYKLAGVDPELIKCTARWRASASYQRYQREKERTARTLMANLRFEMEDEDKLEEEEGDKDDDEGDEEDE